jgi:hypothetical protein
MPEDLAMIEGEYLRDLLHQPQALENTLTNLETSKSLQDDCSATEQGQIPESRADWHGFVVPCPSPAEPGTHQSRIYRTHGRDL